MASIADEDASRRSDELEALQAFYEDDVDVSEAAALSGPWRIRVCPDAVLEIRFPLDYPSKAPPIPTISAQAWVLDERRLAELETEMVDMYSPDTEVVILWAEFCREKICYGETAALEKVFDNEERETEQVENGSLADNIGDSELPSTSKYGQPVRHFDPAVVIGEENICHIHRGEPFHPPKSGPSEKMQAHVARVNSMAQVNWVIAELLLTDKNVARATHNMIAYKFWDKNSKCMISDNDDDGEKGSGAKLAALLEMTDAKDVLVVVSRWYGGIHLGPARFKHIATTARDAMQEAGFLNKPSDVAADGSGVTGKRKGRKR